MSDVKVISEPSVYLLGKQVVQHSELDRFLSDHGVSWSSDSEVPAEVLTETAGRVCYMSFAKPRPGGNYAYLNHIKEVGHGCYDADTDVLTLSGWKSWADVEMSDKIATLNRDTGIVEYHNPIRLIKYDYSGPMYRVDSQQVDLLVTPNHKMYVCQTTTKEGRKKQKYELVTASELGHVSHAYVKNCKGSNNGWWTSCPGRDVFALLGFSIGDGNMSARSRRAIKFRLRRERKILWLKSLCARLSSQGFVLSQGPDDRFTVTLPHGDMENGLVTHLFSGIYDDDGEKQIPWSESVFSGASREGLEGLFEGLMQSDGHESDTGLCFDTTSPHLPGQVQQLCLHVGLVANITYTYGPERRESSYGTKPLTRVTVISRSVKPEVNKWSGCDGKTFWVNEWKGEVYCAEVPNNTLYVRRNGRPVWSGNSVLEHGVWNLLVTGVSRSLTHELVRHRAGFAYSQLSQRYVDESVAEYVVPPDLQEQIDEGYGEWTSRWFKADFSIDEYLILRDHHKAGTISEDAWAGIEWLFSVGVAQRAYGVLSDHLSKKSSGRFTAKTEARKFSRQASRSVLPNATETKIFVTLNARAARHFVEQRGSQHAEPEIRKLANAILDVLVKDAPNLFGDYRRTELPDGTFEITTDYPKV